MTVPVDLIGWIITPIGIVITLWVLLKRVKEETLQYYMHLAIVWTAIAIVFDYIFNVKMFNLGSNYYNPDIYLYYIITFILPLLVYTRRKSIEK